jgi:hypothetical protein
MTGIGNGREGKREFLSRQEQKVLFCFSSLPAVGATHLQIPGVLFDAKCKFAVNICILNIECATCHPAGA